MTCVLALTSRMRLLAVVGDEQVSAGVHRHAHGAYQFGGGGRSAVAAIAPVPLPATVVMTCVLALTSRMQLFQVSAMNRSPLASTATPAGRRVRRWWPVRRRRYSLDSVAGDGGDDVRARVDLADAVVAVSAMNRSPLASTAMPSGSSSSARWPVRHRRYSRRSVAGDGGNEARGGVDFADAVVEVGDEQISAGVHRDANGKIKRGGSSGGIVAQTAARDGGDDVR